MRDTEDNPKERATRSRGAKLALRGAAVSGSHVVSTQKPYCDEPVWLVGRTSPYKEGRTILVESWVPCRKCAKCLQFRQMKWRTRALNEISRAKRTWFVTLTFDAIHLAGIMAEAQGWSRLSEEQSIDRAAYAHVQRYLKRLRKASNCKIRFLAVFERGEKTGRPHYHLLIHEHGPRPVLKRDLEMQWRSNVHARLVAEDRSGAASYVTKYATKSAAVRLRASAGYGRQIEVEVPKRLFRAPLEG